MSNKEFQYTMSRNSTVSMPSLIKTIVGCSGADEKQKPAPLQPENDFGDSTKKRLYCFVATVLQGELLLSPALSCCYLQPTERCGINYKETECATPDLQKCPIVDGFYVSIKEMTEIYFTEAKFEIIKRNFGLSEDDFTKHVQKLYEWLMAQPHLPHDIDYITLQKFVVSAKFLQEKAEKKLDAYFTIRSLVPYIFSNRDPFCPEIKKCNSCMYLGFLPGLTETGARCIIVRLRDPNPDNFSFVSILRRWYFLMDIWLREDNFVYKIHIIVDSAESTVRHLVKISPKKVKESSACYQNVYPIGLESVVFLNAWPMVKVLLEEVLKPMLKEKIAKKVYVYGDAEINFSKGLDKSMLPKEYGGEGPTLEEINDRWIAEVNRNREWLMCQGSNLPDEDKRKKEDHSRGSCCVM